MKKVNIIKYIIFSSKILLIVSIVFFLTLKFFGYPDRYDLKFSFEPMSWSEIYNTMPRNIAVIVTLTLFLTIILTQAKKADEIKRKKEKEQYEEYIKQQNENTKQ
jgi:hypothetical protein